jgi:PAS domain S-box-containing protein
LEDWRLDILLENTSTAIAMFDRDMRCIAASRRWILDHGHEPPIVGRPLREISREIPQGWNEAFQRALAGASVQAEEDRFQSRDGRTRWLRWRVFPWRDREAAIGGVVVFSEDISETKEALRRLDETQRRLQAVMEAAPVGISYSDDATCQRVTGNKALWKQFEATPQENISASAPDPDAVGRKLRFLKGARQIPDYELPLQRAVAERREIPPTELEVVLPSGKRWHTLASGAPVIGENDEIIGGVAVTVDITNRRRMEQALRDADRRKDEFLAVLAHELRNPLAPLRNALYVLRRSMIADRAADLLEMMERQVDNLVRLVDDLMEVSRITRGKIRLRKEILDLREIVGLAAATSAPAIEAKGQVLALALGEEDPMVKGDRTRLVQVFTNLLNNAAKFTPKGGRIEIALTLAGKEVSVCVRDNGRGISNEMQQRIFELFVQENELGERGEGIGVGLALARGIVEMHCGRLEGYSEGVGRGSAFTVRLPLVSGRPVAAEREKTSCGKSPAKRILVVDDNREAADTLVALLQDLGENAHAAYSGEEALKTVPAFRPDIVFLDIGMPKMDGCEAARRIRRLPDSDAIWLVALSGWGREQDRGRSLEAGFRQHLVKPISIKALRACLASCGT